MCVLYLLQRGDFSNYILLCGITVYMNKCDVLNTKKLNKKGTVYNKHK